MLSLQLAAFLFAATMLLAVGCGGSSKSATTTASTADQPTNSTVAASASDTATQATEPVKLAGGKPLSQKQWIAKGDAICAQLLAELEADPITSLAGFARVMPQAAAYERAEVAQLLKLTPPASKMADWQQFLNDTSQWAADTQKLGELAQVGKFSATSPIARATINIQKELTGIAKRDGFHKCSLP